jgi:hypothetical protein
METLLKHIPMAVWLSFAPILMQKLGDWFKSKDTNNTGGDDAFGNVVIAAIPAVAAIGQKDESKTKVALRAVRDTITKYLGE